MNDDRVFAIVCILVIVTIFGGMVWYSQATCSAKTINIGFAHRWSLLGSCQIEVNPNQWIPLENYYFKQQ